MDARATLRCHYLNTNFNNVLWHFYVGPLCCVWCCIYIPGIPHALLAAKNFQALFLASKTDQASAAKFAAAYPGNTMSSLIRLLLQEPKCLSQVTNPLVQALLSGSSEGLSPESLNTPSGASLCNCISAVVAKQQPLCDAIRSGCDVTKAHPIPNYMAWVVRPMLCMVFNILTRYLLRRFRPSCT